MAKTHLTEALTIIEELTTSTVPANTQGIIVPPSTPAPTEQENDQTIELLSSIRDLIGQLVTAEQAEQQDKKQGDVPDADELTDNPEDYPDPADDKDQFDGGADEKHGVDDGNSDDDNVINNKTKKMPR